jgi:hypothetical protein
LIERLRQEIEGPFCRHQLPKRDQRQKPGHYCVCKLFQKVFKRKQENRLADAVNFG